MPAMEPVSYLLYRLREISELLSTRPWLTLASLISRSLPEHPPLLPPPTRLVSSSQHSRHTGINPARSVQVVKVDFTDKPALVKALQGNEAVVLTLGGLPELFDNTKAIVDAAIEAGIKRVIPSEFAT